MTEFSSDHASRPHLPLATVPVHSREQDQIPSYEIQRAASSSLTEDNFRSMWATGDPLLLYGVLQNFQLDWDPPSFINKYGSQECDVVDCQTGDVTKTTVKKFFRRFMQTSSPNQTLKLKDWPPTSDFRLNFPELYEDFSQAVPMPNYVRRDGVFNISSHFPEKAVPPDLGPKMYNAYGNPNGTGVDSQGSTKLHMDMADALNIMMYATSQNGQPGCAAWDIFRASDSDQLRAFIQKRFSLIGPDPIHSQEVYLDDESRYALWQETGVKSYRVYQQVGEAIFIPAGCAHQVCNLSHCIKVAIDFVSLENIGRCEQLTREFREQNVGRAWKEDVLQLRAMMWFAWLSCLKQEEDNARLQ
ncbi:Clavaminate synthase-like protein [Mycena venus]|uniref:Clavaminate synthase-like protein n=1 Tax=Mycena venus TaxID=2733690 RepID=A0A8H6YMR1_9AGAR|nr:Clavaminate synthase-like protein [Mycena venus]